MACWLYEGMLLFAVVFVAGWLFSTLGQMRDAMDARRPLLQAFLFVVFGIYFVWFWSTRPDAGHEDLGHPRGRPRRPADPSGARLLRYLLSWIWFLPPLAAHRCSVQAVGRRDRRCSCSAGSRSGRCSAASTRSASSGTTPGPAPGWSTPPLSRTQPAMTQRTTSCRRQSAESAARGLTRVWHAALISLAGLRAGWSETAFRQEAIAALVLLPLAFWLGRSWVEVGAAGRHACCW